uniref:Uncharacterized protein n=1 Tax=Polytomella parva TaxID=51329 RepID=A0A7S0YDR6_9CHLO
MEKVEGLEGGGGGGEEREEMNEGGDGERRNVMLQSLPSESMLIRMYVGERGRGKGGEEVEKGEGEGRGRERNEGERSEGERREGETKEGEAKDEGTKREAEATASERENNRRTASLSQDNVKSPTTHSSTTSPKAISPPLASSSSSVVNAPIKISEGTRVAEGGEEMKLADEGRSEFKIQKNINDVTTVNYQQDNDKKLMKKSVSNSSGPPPTNVDYKTSHEASNVISGDARNDSSGSTNHSTYRPNPPPVSSLCASPSTTSASASTVSLPIPPLLTLNAVTDHLDLIFPLWFDGAKEEEVGEEREEGKEKRKEGLEDHMTKKEKERRDVQSK